MSKIGVDFGPESWCEFGVDFLGPGRRGLKIRVDLGTDFVTKFAPVSDRIREQNRESTVSSHSVVPGLCSELSD